MSSLFAESLGKRQLDFAPDTIGAEDLPSCKDANAGAEVSRAGKSRTNAFIAGCQNPLNPKLFISRTACATGHFCTLIRYVATNTPVRSSPSRQCTKTFCCESRNSERNCATSSLVGAANPAMGICTNRMPNFSACCRSHSDLPRSSARRSTIVVIPSFFNSSNPCSFGCAPRYSPSLIFPGFGMPRIFNFSPYADDITDGVIGCDVFCARSCGVTQRISNARGNERALTITILMPANGGRMEKPLCPYLVHLHM